MGADGEEGGRGRWKGRRVKGTSTDAEKPVKSFFLYVTAMSQSKNTQKHQHAK
jgi:hypothetical protein